MSGLVIERRDFFAGVDVGQVNDPTAIAIVERVTPEPNLRELPEVQHEAARKAAKAMPLRFDLRHLERIQLGTPYPQQVEQVSARLNDHRLCDVSTFLDMTGCGRPVFDMFRQARLPNLSGVMITSARGEPTSTPYGWNVGKAELVARVQVEMQTGRLRIGSRIEHVDLLVGELLDFRARQSAAGHMTFNAREGKHDDLVLALALAIFGAVRPRPVFHLETRFAA